jgi:hypothetical protein
VGPSFSKKPQHGRHYSSVCVEVIDRNFIYYCRNLKKKREIPFGSGVISILDDS